MSDGDATKDRQGADVETPGGTLDRLLAFWNRMREPWWARWTIDISILALIFFAITSFQTRDMVAEGKEIPELHLESAEGGTAPLVDPEAERTLVYFWAPWCGVCTAESGTLDRARTMMGEGVAVRSVVFDYRDREHARKSAEQKGVDPPVLLGNRRVQETFRIDAFPTFYVVSNDGRVLHRTKGYTTTVGLLWRVWW